MRTINVSQFKAHALSVLKGVAETGEKLLVTKHGKPLAVVSPYEEPEVILQEGGLAGTILEEHNLVRSVDLEVGGE